jgi:cell division protein FtsZ
MEQQQAGKKRRRTDEAGVMMFNLDANLDAMRFTIAEEVAGGTKIKVVGVGGGGANAAARMMQSGLTGVEFYVLNTDVQALQASPVPNKLAIGTKITSGLGAGSDPAIGRQAALEDTEKIIELLEGADMVFVTAGLGGGTGTGAAPVVAALAKELGALTVAVVTKPFEFEGKPRMRMAEKGLAELAGTVDTVITIPNEKLLDIAPEDASFVEGFQIADDVLRQGVQGISDIITRPGLINRDFSDVRSIMLGMGYAMMGTAMAKGTGAAVEAARHAISSPLLEDGGIRGARGILMNITGPEKMLRLRDVQKACNLIREAVADEEVPISFGLVLDDSMGEEVKITVIATGFQRAGASLEGFRLNPPQAQPPQISAPMREPEPVRATAAAAPGGPTDYAPQASVGDETVEEPVEMTYQAMPQTHADAIAPEVYPQTSLPESGYPHPGAQQQATRSEGLPSSDLDTPSIFRRGTRRLFQ